MIECQKRFKRKDTVGTIWDHEGERINKEETRSDKKNHFQIQPEAVKQLFMGYNPNYFFAE